MQYTRSNENVISFYVNLIWRQSWRWSQLKLIKQNSKWNLRNEVRQFTTFALTLLYPNGLSSRLARSSARDTRMFTCIYCCASFSLVFVINELSLSLHTLSPCFVCVCVHVCYAVGNFRWTIVTIRYFDVANENTYMYSNMESRNKTSENCVGIYIIIAYTVYTHCQRNIMEISRIHLKTDEKKTTLINSTHTIFCIRNRS